MEGFSMQRILHKTPVAFMACLVAAIAALAMLASFQVTSTAKRLQVAHAEQLVRIAGSYANNATEAYQDYIEQFVAAVPEWHGDERDVPQLQQLVGPLRASSALFGTDGRQVVTAGDPSAVPASSYPGHQQLFDLVEEAGMGVSASMLSSDGQRLLAFGMVMPSHPELILVMYHHVEDVELSAYLQEFARGRDALFTIVEADGRSLWASEPGAIDQMIPAFSSIDLTEAVSLARVDVEGTDTVVISMSNDWGWTYLYQEPAASFFGGLESQSQRLVTALVVLMAIGTAAFAFVLYRRNRAARRQAQRLEGLVANVNDVVLVLDGPRVIYASPAVERVLFVPEQAAVGADITDIVGAAGADSLQQLIHASSGRKRPISGDIPCQVRPGQTVWVEATVADRTHDPAIGGTVIALHEITERRQDAERHLHAATHDWLTQLGNRAKFGEDVMAAMRRAKRDGSLCAVLYLDLDGFKEVNDSHGHQFGDHVLQEVARRLTRCLRETDLAARMGGDEFAVAISSITDHSQPARVASRIIDALNQPIELDGISASIGVSIGIAYAEDGNDSYEALMRDADLAMYQAKESGKNRSHTSGRTHPLGVTAR